MKRLASICALLLAACADGGGSGPTSVDFNLSNPRPAPEHALAPDLTVNEPMLASSLSFGQELTDATSCQVIEGCLPADSGTRDVLRFDVGVVNLGDAHLYVGDPADNPDDFDYSDCHGHYHHIGFADYELRNAGGVVATGRKQAFCLMDISDYGNDGDPSMQFDCANQGISIGWQDVYDKTLDCQFVDITGLPSGGYTLSVTVNSEGRIEEYGPAPNTVSVPVTIP